MGVSAHLEDTGPEEKARATARSHSVDVQLRGLNGHPCAINMAEPICSKQSMASSHCQM